MYYKKLYVSYIHNRKEIIFSKNSNFIKSLYIIYSYIYKAIKRLYRIFYYIE